MKNLLKLFCLSIIITNIACDDDEEVTHIPPYIVGEWVNTGYYQEGIYFEGGDCYQLEKITFYENESGVAHEEFCQNAFPDRDFYFEREIIEEDFYQIIFTNDAPWLTEQGHITTATINGGKIFLETFYSWDIDNPDRSSYIAVYEKI